MGPLQYARHWMQQNNTDDLPSQTTYGLAEVQTGTHQVRHLIIRGRRFSPSPVGGRAELGQGNAKDCSEDCAGVVTPKPSARPHRSFIPARASFVKCPTAHPLNT